MTLLTVVQSGFISRHVHARLQSLCVVLTICATLVNTQTDTQTDRRTIFGQTVSQKRPPFYFLNNSVKIDRFSWFWCVKSCDNLTLIIIIMMLMMMMMMMQPHTTIRFQRRDVYTWRRTPSWFGRWTFHLQVLSWRRHPHRDWKQNASHQKSQPVNQQYRHFLLISTYTVTNHIITLRPL